MSGRQRGRKSSPQNVPAAGVIMAFVILAIIIWAMVGLEDDSPQSAPSAPAKTAAQVKAETAKCASDLQCWADKFQVDAVVACRPQIERKALHSVKWTDGFLTPTFSRLAWADAGHKSIRYIGDKVEFQNGFGAMTPMSYICTYDTAGKQLVNTEVFEGRLP